MKKFILLPVILTLITLAWLFIPNHPELNKYSFINSPTETPKQTQKVSMIFGGDVMLGRTVMTTTLDKDDFKYPFLEVADFMKSAALTFVNLENPIIEKCPEHIAGFTFCASPQMLEGLNHAGVDVVSIVNNHTLNYGRDGFEETKKHLKEAGILYVDGSNIAIKQLNNVKFGFIAFDKSQLSNPKLNKAETDLIKQANLEADVLIVSMHWGLEYQDKALPGVHALAKEIIDLGGDVIVGHHPHWVQDYEKINGKPVYYSLGNLVFDQMWSEKTRAGMLVKLTFGGACPSAQLCGEEYKNTYMEDWAQPEILN